MNDKVVLFKEIVFAAERIFPAFLAHPYFLDIWHSSGFPSLDRFLDVFSFHVERLNPLPVKRVCIPVYNLLHDSSLGRCAPGSLFVNNTDD